jgi:hypothetical protein
LVVLVDAGVEISDGFVASAGEIDKSLSNSSVKFGSCFCISAGSGGIWGGWYGALGGFDRNEQLALTSGNISTQLSFFALCNIICFP